MAATDKPTPCPSPCSPPCAAPYDAAAEAHEMAEMAEFLRQQDPIDLAAAQWHTRQEQGLNATEQAELQHWLAASPAHAAAWETLAHTLADLRAIPAAHAAPWRTTPAHSASAPPPQPQAAQPAPSSPGSAPHSSPGALPRPFRPFRRLRHMLAGLLQQPTLVALGCAAVLGAGIGWHQWQQPAFTGSYAADRGQRSTITLPDGTELALDADTQAQVTLYRNRREVRLTQGQIMLAVAPDSQQPFDVLAGPARITVVGTRFSVRYRNTGMLAGAAQVAVEAGRVRVTGMHADNAQPASPVELGAGQSLTVPPNGAIAAEAITAIAPSHVGLWRKGLVRFDNTPLAQALQELERYGPTGLVIHDSRVAALPIGGSYAIAHPDEFARMVARLLPVRLVAGADGVTEMAPR